MDPDVREVPANDIVATIHDRMPAIHDKPKFSQWFGDEADPRDLLTLCPGDQLKVSPLRRG